MTGILVVSLILLCAVGWQAGRRVRCADGFHLGDRELPVWAAALSFTAAEISAMTLVGVPAIAYRQDWRFLQFFVGAALARLAVAGILLPALHHCGCVSVYELLRAKLGAPARLFAALLFFLTRTLASGVRLMAVCAIAAAFLGWPVNALLLLFAAVSIGCLMWGGVRAAVWTGVLQTAFFFLAGAALVVFLVSGVDGGLAEVLRLAENAGRLKLWKWAPEGGSALLALLADADIVWLAVITGFFGSLAAFGTDHEMVQRLLSVRDCRGGQRAVILSMFSSFGVLVLYLLVGTALFAFYDQHPEMALPGGADQILPHFAIQNMGPVLKGLLLAAVVMASIDLPLAGMATVFVRDIYLPYRGRSPHPLKDLRVARSAAGVSGLVLVAAAYLLGMREGLLWLAFKIGGITYGPLLGAFCYAILAERFFAHLLPRVRWAAAAAMGTSFAVCFVLLALAEGGGIPLGWHWLPLLGAVLTGSLTHLLILLQERFLRGMRGS